ncbi:MAG: (Na+)-NQR maturation NqrM [Planctomycetota bacterium]
MKLFLLTLLVFVLALLGLSVGVIFRNRQIRTSCGELSQLDAKHGKLTCDGCSSGRGHCGSVHTTWDKTP